MSVVQEIQQMKVTHTVVKREDIQKYLTDQEQIQLNIMISNIAMGRLKDGKSMTPYYIVANTDEEPAMLEELIAVMKRYNKWG